MVPVNIIQNVEGSYRTGSQILLLADKTRKNFSKLGEA